jgi:hypothetical protein
MMNRATAEGPDQSRGSAAGQSGDWREHRRIWREQRREARRTHPFHGLTFGLILILLGGLFMANQAGIVVGDRWWQWLLIGLGAILIVGGLVPLLGRQQRIVSYGQFVGGIILIGIGALCMAGFGFWWPVALIAAGVAVLVSIFLRQVRSS